MFILQAAKLFGATEIEIPHTSVLFVSKAALNANDALWAGNKVLGWCYWGFIVFIGLCLIFSSVCCIFKRRVDFSFFLFIPLFIFLPDMYFAFKEGDYMLMALHAVFGIVPLFAAKPLEAYRGLKARVWGEDFKNA